MVQTPDQRMCAVQLYRQWRKFRGHLRGQASTPFPCSLSPGSTCVSCTVYNDKIQNQIRFAINITVYYGAEPVSEGSRGGAVQGQYTLRTLLFAAEAFQERCGTNGIHASGRYHHQHVGTCACIQMESGTNRRMPGNCSGSRR